MEPKNQELEPVNEFGLQELQEESAPTELDNEIECPRCNDSMELNSKFDSLVYFCDGCNFVLKCV
jgi:Luciferase-like monooxygenase